MIDQAGAGRDARRAAEGGHAAHQGRHRARRGVLARRRRRTRSRTGARTSASRSTRARSRPASSPATGTTPASTSCRAARSTCGPTTRAASTPTVRDGDVFVRRRADADPIGHLQARLRNGLEEEHHARRREVGARACSTRACPRPTSCAPASTSARRTAARAGARDSPCSSRWRTSSRTSTATTARSRSCTDWRSSRTTPATRRRASPSVRCRRRACRSARLAAWYRRFVDTRSSDSAERTLETAHRRILHTSRRSKR